MERKYEIVLTFILPNGQEVYGLWDIDLFFTLRSSQKLSEFLLSGEKNGFGIDPINVECWIYLNPKIMTIDTPMGQEMICTGKKIFLIETY